MYTEDDAAWDDWISNTRSGQEFMQEAEDFGTPSHTALMRRDDETLHINAYPSTRQVVLTYPPAPVADFGVMLGVVRELPVASADRLAAKYATEIDRHLREGWILAHSTAAIK